jgi:hypothetical protein
MIRAFLFFLVVTLCPAVSFGQDRPGSRLKPPITYCLLGTAGVVVDAKPMNGAAATLTFTIAPSQCGRDAASYQYLVLESEFTHSTNGNVLWTCLTGATVATATKTPQTCTGSGTCTAVDAAIFSKAVTGNKKWAVRLGVQGYRAWSCVASHDGGPGAGDILTASAYLTD